MEDTMTNYKYREIRKTESRLNDRLLNFIMEKNEMNHFMDGLDIGKPPLDNWIISDYKKINGNTYIDEFLELYAHTLDPLEIEILNQKSISHISMFEMTKISGNKIYIEDQLDDTKSYTIIDDSISNVLLEGDYILARVASIRGQYIFIGDVEYIPSSIISELYERILIYFNRERMNKPNLEIKNYLKRYSLDIYALYKECLADHMEETEDEIPLIISDISDFQEYAIDHFPKDYHIYMTNLMEIFEYTLMDKELTLQDIDQIDIAQFFKDAIEDGFIKSKEDYHSYLDTLKAYLIFLGPSNPEYKATYNQLIEISKNRFKYMDHLKNNNFNYDYDRMLVSTITNRLSTDALTFVGDLDRFLIFVMEFEIELTEKKKEIRKKELLSINKLLKLSQPFSNSRPSQKDSKIIPLLYHLTLALNLTMIIDQRMVITEKGKNFFKLRDEEKYAIAFSYVWQKDSEPTQRKDDALILMGVTESHKEDSDIAFTSLGRLIYRYITRIKEKETRVISFQSYKEKKTEEV